LNNVSLHQFLVLYTWFPLAALLLFMLLIARFYQRFSGERTFFWLYILSAILFGAMCVRYASVGIVIGDFYTDILSISAGVLLIFLSFLLRSRMLNKQKIGERPQ
jgi:hypothetical protein